MSSTNERFDKMTDDIFFEKYWKVIQEIERGSNYGAVIAPKVGYKEPYVSHILRRFNRSVPPLIMRKRHERTQGQRYEWYLTKKGKYMLSRKKNEKTGEDDDLEWIMEKFSEYDSGKREDRKQYALEEIKSHIEENLVSVYETDMKQIVIKCEEILSSDDISQGIRVATQKLYLGILNVPVLREDWDWLDNNKELFNKKIQMIYEDVLPLDTDNQDIVGPLIFSVLHEHFKKYYKTDPIFRPLLDFVIDNYLFIYPGMGFFKDLFLEAIENENDRRHVKSRFLHVIEDNLLDESHQYEYKVWNILKSEKYISL